LEFDDAQRNTVKRVENQVLLNLASRPWTLTRFIAPRFIANIAALITVLGISSGISVLSRTFNELARGYLEPASIVVYWQPRFLNGTRLDVICALLIPISIVVWQPSWSTASKSVVACCLGIAAGLVPVAVQIISWPFIMSSPDAVGATADMAVFASAVLSVSVTEQRLKTDLPHAVALPVLPSHIRRGLIRLYVILLIPWVGWFGYMACRANASLNSNFSQAREFGRLSIILDDADPATPQTPATRYARHELGFMASVWDAKTNDEIGEHIEAAIEYSEVRLTMAIYALLGGAAPPLLYPVFVWAVAGFRKPASTSNDAPCTSPEREASRKPPPIREPNAAPPHDHREGLTKIWLVRATVVCLFVLNGIALRSPELHPSIPTLIKGFIAGLMAIGLSLLIGRLGKKICAKMPVGARLTGTVLYWVGSAIAVLCVGLAAFAAHLGASSGLVVMAASAAPCYWAAGWGLRRALTAN
jgi:hypothetical protein